ncbi:MAG TPA: hypothetical protein G4N96_06045 [Chloroflexi bacterium]|nr:hypothetical protein [Chloroflexota bacterium]
MTQCSGWMIILTGLPFASMSAARSNKNVWTMWIALRVTHIAHTHDYG